MPAILKAPPAAPAGASMPDKSDLTGIASAAEMVTPPAFESYLTILDRILCAAAPEGCDASLSGKEWVAVRRAFANKVPAEALAKQLVAVRELADYRDTDAPGEWPDILFQLDLSNRLERINGRLRSIEAHNERIANFVQSQPTREEYDALVAENHQIREQLRALSLRRAS